MSSLQTAFPARMDRETETETETGPESDWLFLVSTTQAARDIGRNLGNADYSYAFVFKAFQPILEAFGGWRLIDAPESRLIYQADRARAEGRRPVHLCLQPPQNGYLAPGVPTIFFPFWEFPEIPDRPFEHDTRQNWRRILDRADLILTACRFTAETFRNAGLRPPVAVVPVPIADAAFDLPDWDPQAAVELNCRHIDLGETAGPAPAAESVDPPRPRKPLWKRAARRAYAILREFYRKNIRRWLSPEAVERLFQFKNRLIGRSAFQPERPPIAPLRLEGLVFTSVFNLGDRRKNIEDMLSAFITAFRDRPDVTLVLKLVTNEQREYHELEALRSLHDRLQLDHDCRIVAVTDYLDAEQMNALKRGTTFYVNTSRAEGSCLPLQEALAGGRPAIAPRHTALLDYIDEHVAIVIESDPEPTFFPHDPAPRFETSWHRLNWRSLRDAFLEADRIASTDLDRYEAMARAARERIRRNHGAEAASAALGRALQLLPEDVFQRRHAWSA